MTEHTPTPWRVEEGTDLIWGACNPDDQSTRGMGYSIAQGKSGSWGDRKPDMDEREANAAFIVKAVNNHDALTKAINNYLATFDRCGGSESVSAEEFADRRQQMRVAVEAAGQPSSALSEDGK